MKADGPAEWMREAAEALDAVRSWLPMPAPPDAPPGSSAHQGRGGGWNVLVIHDANTGRAEAVAAKGTRFVRLTQDLAQKAAAAARKGPE